MTTTDSLPPFLPVATSGPLTREHPGESTATLFARRGFLGPLPVLDHRECREILEHRRSGRIPAPIDWPKGLGATSRLLFDVASRSALSTPVRSILGDDVLLWGASFVDRPPRSRHRWHTDHETADLGDRSVSVWIGLTGTSARSGLRVIAGSHRYGITAQSAAERQASAMLLDDSGILAAARELDPTAALETPDVHDGEAILFDGRLWHSGLGEQRHGDRVALLLQYVRPDGPVHLTRRRGGAVAVPRPPCVMISGRVSDLTHNRVVAPPPRAGSRAVLTSRVQPLEVPLADDPRRGFLRHPILDGQTPNVSRLSAHATSLSPGRCPHPPHAHGEEELLLILDGEAELLWEEAAADDLGSLGERATIGFDRDDGVVSPADAPSGPTTVRVIPVGKGDCAYYPAGFSHTLRNRSQRPVSYLMLKWTSDGGSAEGPPLAAALLRPRGPGRPIGDGARRVERLLQGPTHLLRKLRVHLSTVAPGGGYPPHVDAHDVALVVLDGAIETLGETVEAGGMVFCAAGEPHGLHNPGRRPARYLVVELHRGDAVIGRPGRRARGRSRLRRLGSRALVAVPPLQRLYLRVKALLA